MDLQLIEGKVAWVKKDGSIANKPVSTLAELTYLGFFPSLRVEPLKVLDYYWVIRTQTQN